MSVEPPRIFTLPLFPLGSVLFPQFPLQLHIFEERYKVMINACIEKEMPFGVILIREGREVGAPASPHDVGCVARILGVERLEDGRMNLLAVCEQRFRVLDYMEADLPYLIGRVEEVDDQPVHSDVTTLISDLSDLFVRYLRLLAARANVPMPDVDLPDDPQTLAFCVASVAMLQPLDKQQLLEMTDTRARLQNEVRLLREQIVELEAAEALELEAAEALEFDETTDEAGEGIAENSEDTANGEADGSEDDSEADLESPRILIARPVDLQTRRWQKYIHTLRN